MKRTWLTARRIATDVAARIVGRARQTTIARGDPLHFEPCIEHHGPRLGFHHMYTPESVRQTDEWLESAVYVDEAKKQHPIDACHLALSQYHAFLALGDERIAAGAARHARTPADLRTLAELGASMARNGWSRVARLATRRR